MPYHQFRGLFFAAVATAAFSAAAKAASPVYNWTGCYVGGHAGVGWTKSHLFDGTPLDLGAPKGEGLFGGGQAGCDLQMAALVVGVAGKFSWADIIGDAPDPSAPPIVMHSKFSQFSTATARVGFAAGPWLIYADGGLAWMRSHYRFDQAGTNDHGDETANNSGRVIGGGFEYAAAPNWAFFVQYSHFDFGTKQGRFICDRPLFCGVPSFASTTTARADSVMVGFNYRFGAR